MKFKSEEIYAQFSSTQPFVQSQSKNNREHIRVFPTKLLRMGKDESSVNIFKSFTYFYQSFRATSQRETTKNGFR